MSSFSMGCSDLSSRSAECREHLHWNDRLSTSALSTETESGLLEALLRREIDGEILHSPVEDFSTLCLRPEVLLVWSVSRVSLWAAVALRVSLRDQKNLKIEWVIKATPKTPEEVVDDFDATEDGESSEKAHCSSYQAQLGFHCHLWIITNMSNHCHPMPPFHLSQSHHRLPCQSRCTLPPAAHAQTWLLRTINERHQMFTYLSFLLPDQRKDA